MDKPNARELLKEAREALADIYGEPGKTIDYDPCMLNLIADIDAYLAAPSESAMEMRKGRRWAQGSIFPRTR